MNREENVTNYIYWLFFLSLIIYENLLVYPKAQIFELLEIAKGLCVCQCAVMPLNVCLVTCVVTRHLCLSKY